MRIAHKGLAHFGKRNRNNAIIKTFQCAVESLLMVFYLEQNIRNFYLTQVGNAKKLVAFGDPQLANLCLEPLN